jgi:hypothetical protein
MDSSSELYDADVAALADLAREFGHHSGRLRYAGVEPHHELRAITVFRVPDPGWDSEILRLLRSDVGVRLADAPHTRDELLVARERVWELDGAIPITAISLPADGTVLAVFADAPAESVQAELDRLVPGLAKAAVDSTLAL